MADMKKVEEGNAFPEKRKLDLPNFINETFEEKVDVTAVEPQSSKRQKLEHHSENEANIDCSFLISGTVAETDDGKEEPRATDKDDKDEHLKVEAEIAYRQSKISAEEKGKAILIEVSDEAEGDFDDNDSIDDSDSDFSDGLDSSSEDIPFLGAD